MRVLVELRIAGSVSGVLDRPVVPHVLQQGLGASAQTRDAVTGLLSQMPLQRTARGAGTPQQLQRDLAFWIERYYNREHCHSTLGPLSQIDYEQHFIAARTFISADP